MPEMTDFSTLTHEQKDDLIRRLMRRVEALEARLSKDSHNSSKPPSSDGFRKPKSLRKASGRSPGGQKGHPGTTLRQVPHPDHVVTQALPDVCDACGASLGKGVVGERRQVFDLPPLRLHVTEHQSQVARCPCGKVHRSGFPDAVTQPVQYGPRIRSAAVYLTQYQLLPLQRTAQLFHDLFGQTLSVGTLVSCLREAQQVLVPSVAAIHSAIKASEVVHFDETGLRVAGSLHWLHSASTPTLTWYGTHAKRGTTAMDDFGLLAGFHGIAVHDGWAPYRNYPCLHALCNAHHLRELIFLSETLDQAWPCQMIELLCAAKTESERAPVSEARIGAYRERYRAIVDVGQALNPEVSRTGTAQRGRIRQTPAVNLLRRLHLYADDVLRFLTHAQVPFDNNQAERDIRMPKLKQKISGAFRTPNGAHAFCTIRSYLSTLRKQGQNIYQALVLSFMNQTPLPVFSGTGAE